MSSGNSFRRFMATPLLAFDSVRVGMQSNPKQANYAMMMSLFVVILMAGNGADKLTTRSSSVAAKFEAYRRLNRIYIPYFIADFRYRFPNLED